MRIGFENLQDNKNKYLLKFKKMIEGLFTLVMLLLLTAWTLD